MTDAANPPAQQSDTLLWLAGAIVVGMGVTWLVIAKPWSDGTFAPDASAPPTIQPNVRPTAAATAPAPPPASRTAIGSSLDDNPLRMARLAHEAGMLVEPEEYSAWALYRTALDREPDSVEAMEGLQTIASELIRRADAALEQGRFDDVQATIDRIRAAIPVHTGANDLAIRLAGMKPRSPARDVPLRVEADDETPPERDAAPQTVSTRADQPEPRAAAAPPEVDPMLAPQQAFETALAGNRLLTPADASAKHFVDVLTALDPTHEVTLAARSRLFDEMLARAQRALDATDTAAAETWVEEAELLGVDAEAIARARGSLRQQLIAIESARRVPASALTVAEYIAPKYPRQALERGMNGWVDLEFTVARDGSTRDVAIVDASHNTYFREEASAAVEAWRFEPHRFLDEPIEQRAYTRIRFEFE